MNSYWINLPVANVKASTEFFRKIGFEINEERSNETTLAAIKVGKQVICLFRKDVLESFMGTESRRLTDYPETIISFDMDSEAEVNQLVQLVQENGGKVLSPPSKKNGYYGTMFSDLDNHLFNVIVM
ncbi:VOC family protein [Macrococcus sp. EM39E]|uniref:VOC family protein n=1 Tax=Macrococcus animalis TaxID=3395467 RepID=UPI0039BF60D5